MEEIDTILFEDESMIRDYQAIMKTWFPVGQQRIIPTYGKHEGVKLVGCLAHLPDTRQLSPATPAWSSV